MTLASPAAFGSGFNEIAELECGNGQGSLIAREGEGVGNEASPFTTSGALPLMPRAGFANLPCPRSESPEAARSAATEDALQD